MSCPSATLVVWTSAWLNGSAAADDVLDALQCWAEPHEVVAHDETIGQLLDLPTTHEQPVSPALLLAALRKLGATAGELVLPVAGDLRGLRGHAPFAAAALHAGEAAVLRTGDEIAGPEGDLGLVPEWRGPAGANSAPADRVLRWTVFRLPAAPAGERMPLGEAEHGLSGAMRAAATALIELDVARHRPNVREEISAVVAATPDLEWPPGMPPRSLKVLARAAEVDAILKVAMTDAPGGALSASATRGRAEALRPLDHAVRAARRAAIDEAVRALSDHADHADKC
ncbi:MAG TPA: hypothetical protein VGM75_38670 [Pseudonocardiaceae bacterium]